MGIGEPQVMPMIMAPPISDECAPKYASALEDVSNQYVKAKMESFRIENEMTFADSIIGFYQWARTTLQKELINLRLHETFAKVRL